MRGAGEAIVEKEDRRGEIILAATRLFSKKGYHETTIDDIAEAMRVTKGLIYYYFESKEQILIEIMKRAIVEVMQELRRIAELPLSPSEKLRMAIRIHASSLSKELQAFLVLLKHNSYLYAKENIKAIDDLAKEYTRLFQSFLEEGMHAGALRKVDSKVLALIIIGAINSIAYWYSPKGPLTIEEISAILEETIMEGVLSSRGSKARKAKGVGRTRGKSAP